MDDGFESPASPERGRVIEKLNQASQQPEQTQSCGNIFTQFCFQQFVREHQAKQSHQRYCDADKKRVHIHHLPVDEAKRFQFFFPFKIAGKKRMENAQQD